MIRTIAVPVFSNTEADWLAPAACELARAFDAHVIVVDGTVPPLIHTGAGADAAAHLEVLAWEEDGKSDSATIIGEAAERAGIPCEYRVPEGAFVRGNFLMSSIRGADLVVIAKAGDEDHYLVREQIIRQAGRPVLVLPQDRPLVARPGRILIGWSDTREAARAAHDALLLCAPRAEVGILAVHHKHPSRHAIMNSRADFAAAIDRLGFRATLVDRESTPGETGETLLAVAFDEGAEMVATGAYGHSALYDFAIGAVTDHLLRQTTVPVLFSK
ncbi:MAG: universal stress protein [Pseudooceanicola sp.]